MNDKLQTLVIVDDDEAVRDSLGALLEVHGFETTKFADATSFLNALPLATAHCLLLDVRMPDMSGLDVLKELPNRAPDLPVVIITGHGDVPMAVEALHAGAGDFIEKPFDEHKLLEAISRAVENRKANENAEAALPVDPELKAIFERLTPREMDVMRQLVIGHPNKIIAHNLGLSPRTVEIHRSRVLEKTQAQSLSHLVRMAIKGGLDPEMVSPSG